MENSSPSVSSSRTTPMEAPVETKAAASGTGAIPPFPRNSPASR